MIRTATAIALLALSPVPTAHEERPSCYKKVDEIAWKPLFLTNLESSSVSATIIPAGPDKALGIVTATIIKDPNDKKWADDPGIKWYRAHFEKYQFGADIGDNKQHGLYPASTRAVERQLVGAVRKRTERRSEMTVAERAVAADQSINAY